MIETTILNFLTKTLAVPVFLEHQLNEPETFVIFERLGGSKKNRVYSSSFAFQSYAKRMCEAADLNQGVMEAVEKMIKLDDIAFVKLDSYYNFTDTATKRYRYQAVFDIKHY